MVCCFYSRALHTLNRALYTFKRVLYILKSALYTLKRAIYTLVSVCVEVVRSSDPLKCFIGSVY